MRVMLRIDPEARAWSNRDQHHATPEWSSLQEGMNTKAQKENRDEEVPGVGNHAKRGEDIDRRPRRPRHKKADADKKDRPTRHDPSGMRGWRGLRNTPVRVGGPTTEHGARETKIGRT